jgi:hypothetical protein
MRNVILTVSVLAIVLGVLGFLSLSDDTSGPILAGGVISFTLIIVANEILSRSKKRRGP